MPKRKTHEEYISEVLDINPNIEVVETYVNNNTKILHRCKIDGYEWNVRPSSILLGSGCPKCNGGIQKTHEQYIEELELKNINVEVIGQYTNSSTPILHKCKIDGHEWLVSPNNILQGKGCPVCGGTMKKTHEQYVKELRIKNPSIIAIEEYVNHATKIMHKCLIHDYEWKTSPSRTLNGVCCPICKKEKARNRLARTHEEYVNKLAMVNKDVIVLERYINGRTPIKHKCLIDGWEWNVIPESLLHGHGCPQCNKCSKSNGEKIVASWLDDNNILYKKQQTFDNCKDKQKLQFDFYLPKYNVVIEYNGKQHYEPIDYFGGESGFEYTLRHDKIKEDYCNENNIMLFKIPYFEDVYDELKKIYDFIMIQEETIGEVAI